MGLDVIRSSPLPDRLRSAATGHLLLVGANHRTCGIDARERLLQRARTGRGLTANGPERPWSDVVLLTTCNRVEVYALTDELATASNAIHRVLGVSDNDRTLYTLEDQLAAAHLLRVASGLDSLAEGEEQVTEQVRTAPSWNPSGTSSRPPLADLFLRAARIAPQIRRIAGVRPEEASASHAAIRFLEAVVRVDHPIVALIGTGKMARIAAKRLQGQADLRILNRSLRRARELAIALDGRAVPMANLRKALIEADVVIAATSVRRPVVIAQSLRAAITRRKGRPLWLIDLGFPRNVDPACRRLDGVHLLDLDGLAPWGRSQPSPTAHAKVEARIRKEAERMIESLHPSGSIDVAVLRKTAEAVRSQEVQEALARLPGLSDEGRAVVDMLATRLVNRILHAPTQRLRSLPEELRQKTIREIVSSLRGGGG